MIFLAVQGRNPPVHCNLIPVLYIKYRCPVQRAAAALNGRPARARAASSSIVVERRMRARWLAHVAVCTRLARRVFGDERNRRRGAVEDFRGDVGVVSEDLA